MGCTSLKGAICVCDSASSVVVEVGFDVARHNTAQRPNKIVHLTRGSATYGICDTDAVDANLVNGAIDGEKVDKVTSEGVFGRESNLQAFALDKLDDLDRGILDVGNVFAVRVLLKVGGSANDNIDTIHTGLDSYPRVVHVAANVGEDLGLEAELANGFAVLARLLRCCGACELNVIDTKVVKRLGDLDLGLRVEEGIGKLFALS